MSPLLHCRNTWKNQKRCSEPDRWLDELGFFRKHTARDPSCLFRAVSENVYNTQRYFNRVRMECVQFMATKRELFEGSLSCSFDNYLKEMSNPGEWGGFTEIAAMSHLYRRDFVIFEANKCPQVKISNGYDKVIHLFYISDSKHFDAVYTKEHINTSSFCQSITYKILYNGVFQLNNLEFAIDAMLHEKMLPPTPTHIEYFMNENVERRRQLKEKLDNDMIDLGDKYYEKKLNKLNCRHMKQADKENNRFDDICFICLDVNSAKALLENGVTPFPYKVAKALDPNMYRNIEFDVWTEMRREMRYGSKYSDGTTLRIGAKCLVRLQPDQTIPYHCHIQEMEPDGGPCLVFIEGIGEKRIVEFCQLEPLPLDEIRPWAPPYRQSRAQSEYFNLSQMLQQLGSISKKNGRNKLKNKLKSVCDEDASPLDMKETSLTLNKSLSSKLDWNDESLTLNSEENDIQNEVVWDSNSPIQAQYYIPNLSPYHMDYFTFEPYPVEITAMPLKVETRGEGESVQSVVETGVVSGVATSVTPTTTVARASTPAVMPPYPAMAAATVMPPMMYGPAGVKFIPSAAIIPPNVNPHVGKSVNANGSDLPMNDIATLRFFFNLGVECLWGGLCAMPPPVQPRIDIADITQEMQQSLTIQDRGSHNGSSGSMVTPGTNGVSVSATTTATNDYRNNKNNSNNDGKVATTTPTSGQHQHHHQGKNNSQRPLVGPRFNKRSNETNQNNKSYNSMGNNKGQTHHRRNSHTSEGREESSAGGEPAIPPAAAYLSYPPPLYHVPYYLPEEHPGVMSYMGGVPYYVEEMDYGPLLPPAYYPPPPPPPPMYHHHAAPPPPHAQPPLLPLSHHHHHHQPPPPQHHHHHK